MKRCLLAAVLLLASACGGGPATIRALAVGGEVLQRVDLSGLTAHGQVFAFRKS